MKRARIGVIGVGIMGANHARVLSELDDVQLVGVCDASKARASKIAEKYRCDSYVDNDRFLRESGAEALVIATPTLTHRELAVSALEHDKHVLIEKPLAASVEEAKDICSVASSRDSVLAVGFIERFNPAVIEAKRLLKSGGVGDPILLVARRLSEWPKRVGDVGVVVDLAIHDIDIARYVFEKDPVEVYSCVGSLRHSFEDYANILLRFNNGETAFIETNWLTPHKVRRLTVTGSKGLISLDYISQDIQIENSLGVTSPRLLYEEPLKVELSHFVSCVRNGEEPLVSGEDGMRALQIADSVLQSSRTHKSISLSF